MLNFWEALNCVGMSYKVNFAEEEWFFGSGVINYLEIALEFGDSQCNVSNVVCVLCLSIEIIWVDMNFASKLCS